MADPTIPPLPEADPATRDAVLGWAERFAARVRAVDYRGAVPFWHPEVLAFGTRESVVQGIAPFRDRQWDGVWPRTADFAFTAEAARVLASADGTLAVLVAPFASTGFAEDGTPFDRPGRATIVLTRAGPGAEDAWVAVHSHLSLARGVPQDSHGNRPVLAR